MKRKFDLQMFAEPVQGKKIVYLFRIHEEAATTDGATIAYVTENERTKSKDADSTETKDGPIRTPGASEVEITATAILAKGDEMIEKLEDAQDKDKLIDIWEANLAEPVGGTYEATSDVALVPGKTYYTRSGSEGSYTYTPVASPDVANISSYYELSAEQFKGMYFQGYLTEIGRTSSAEEFVEVSLTFGVNGVGAKGNVTVSAEQQEQASYVFVDTPKTGA